MKSFNRLYLKFKHKSISSLFFYISSFICSNISSNKSIRIRGEPTNCHPETFVVSSGFGQTAEEAARVASVEVRSYGVDPSKFKLSIEPIQIDGSKVLDFRDPKTLRLFLNSRKMA
jgi:hypothetical protein